VWRNRLEGERSCWGVLDGIEWSGGEFSERRLAMWTRPGQILPEQYNLLLRDGTILVFSPFFPDDRQKPSAALLEAPEEIDEPCSNDTLHRIGSRDVFG